MAALFPKNMFLRLKPDLPQRTLPADAAAPPARPCGPLAPPLPAPTLMVLHYLLREGAVQCVPIQTQLPPAFDVCGFMPIADSMDATRLGMHVLGFFQFYSIYFRYQEHVVTIRTTYVVTRQSKQWTDPLAVCPPAAH